MESIKQSNFEKANPGQPFPQVTLVSAEKIGELRQQIAKHLGLVDTVDGLTLVKRLAELEKHVEGVNADSDNFHLERLLDDLQISAAREVYINWYRFDDIDKIALNDLSRRWSDLWYPGPDDIDVFDESCDWVVSVSPEGDIAYVLLR